ncbi:aconitate hydratase AcnA [Candidatus Viridilinea mediisalina]|uniref:Aconitate hydratase n=1 Tax=Candidatus Viridilinea mediisalina TaxID=2024553 RepID=A0A2A6RKR2_9CHLR|nr:aconitate hydratase AcnA [Candidatus Viridilinea mediisalina]PDW03667.1 aconitate hydratase 1 [Candidatus Viridilinea mediisalina]
MTNSFGARATLQVGERAYEIFRLDALIQHGVNLSRLPYSLRILLENLLRNENGRSVTADDIRALANWDAQAEPDKEVAFTPARVILQDFTGVPCVVDLAAMRDAMATMGGDPALINPLQPVELVIDHSVQVDAFGSATALLINKELEFERNKERYAFLRWGQTAFQNFKVVPPGNGIVHQVNLEYLARVVFTSDENPRATGSVQAYPDTLVGTDSHTTMINGVGVLGWGVGGIEAEAAMLGQPVSMLIPQVVGFKLFGTLPEGTTATDLVLTVTEQLRKFGVVGKFVEFFGPGLAALPLADRATIANMAPEYGATCGIFPVDEETLRYLRFSGRSEERIALVEAYMKTQGLFHDADTPQAEYSAILELDLSTVEPSVAGPRRPQDRITLGNVAPVFGSALPAILSPKGSPEPAALQSTATLTLEQEEHELHHGSVVIAAITSCTNTSNPSVMLAAGLVAKKAVEAGLQTQAWVKPSLAPGSKVVTEYLDQAGLTPYLDKLRFNTVGYGCTTCIGNSGPLPVEVSAAIEQGNLVVASVLSGNRNFEGRVQSEVKANFLMSPPLVVAYALAGRVDIDLHNEPLGTGANGQPIFLRDIWPSQAEVQQVMSTAIKSEMFQRSYASVFEGDEQWQQIAVPAGDRFAWDGASTYVRRPPYFEGMSAEAPTAVAEIQGARVLAVLGDSITTDHISPAGSIKASSPAGKYLLERSVETKDFNSYGSRRGNDEVMVRGTFANVRLRNKLAPGTEGGFAPYLPTGEVLPLYDAAMRYKADGTPLLIIAGKEYGSGSSRDWAAKGPYLQGIKAVIAESYERIHRSNLVGMGILPLQFLPGQSAESLGLSGTEIYNIVGLADAIASGFATGRTLTIHTTASDGSTKAFQALARIDTPQEIQYYIHGGILQYVLRQLLAENR